MKPLDERLRNAVKYHLRPPAVWIILERAADEVTSLLIANEELTKQNQELCDTLNEQHWTQAREIMNERPF